MSTLRGRPMWEKWVREQETWIAEQGGDREGYIANYHGRHGRTVENAVAIYDADLACLSDYKRHLANYRRD